MRPVGREDPRALGLGEGSPGQLGAQLVTPGEELPERGGSVETLLQEERRRLPSLHVLGHVLALLLEDLYDGEVVECDEVAHIAERLVQRGQHLRHGGRDLGFTGRVECLKLLDCEGDLFGLGLVEGVDLLELSSEECVEFLNLLCRRRVGLGRVRGGSCAV